MRKILFLVISIIFFFIFSTSVEARILTVSKDGTVILNVLSYEDSLTLSVPKNESLEVKEVAKEEEDKNSYLLLAKEGEDIKLNVVSQEGEKELNVTNIEGDLIEIEERPSVKNIKIGLLENMFYVQEGGVLALTEYPINIDPEHAEISINTPSGQHFLAISPAEAYQYSLRAKKISKLTEEDIVISEKKVGEVTYEIPGLKTLNLLGLVKYDFPVKVSVSALTGEIINVEQEVWLKVLNFFFG